ncbi:hypothetical protein CJ230_08830 [Oligella urethralis]|nr:hypothetical protein CJ230_08830 [Oligella urethralis]
MCVLTTFIKTAIKTQTLFKQQVIALNVKPNHSQGLADLNKCITVAHIASLGKSYGQFTKKPLPSFALEKTQRS